MRWFGRIHCHRARNSPPPFRRETPLQKNCVRIGFSISCATIKHYNSEKSRASDAFSIVSNHTMSMWITTDTRIFCPLSLSFPHTHTYTRTFQTYFINDKSFSSEKHSNNNIEWAKEKKNISETHYGYYWIFDWKFPIADDEMNGWRKYWLLPIYQNQNWCCFIFTRIQPTDCSIKRK